MLRWGGGAGSGRCTKAFCSKGVTGWPHEGQRSKRVRTSTRFPHAAQSMIILRSSPRLETMICRSPVAKHAKNVTAKSLRRRFGGRIGGGKFADVELHAQKLSPAGGIVA